MTRRRRITRMCITALGLCAAALLACKGGAKQKCATTVTLEGKPGQGTGDGRDESIASACLDWCTQHDPTLDQAHRTWKATPEGSASKDSRFGEMYNVPGGSQMLQQCKARCQGKISTDSSAARVNCT